MVGRHVALWRKISSNDGDVENSRPYSHQPTTASQLSRWMTDVDHVAPSEDARAEQDGAPR
eukprot:2066483-Pyramimonas_sp.AAC.1